MNEPLFLKPVFKERIWGGTALQDKFGYTIPSDHTGECWAISAHPNGQSIIENGIYKGITLGALWESHPELFGNPNSKAFPLLTKILDANHDLSVQVHPNDEYANKYENGELGKTECWYIIDCKQDAEMVFGHHALSKQELVRMIEKGEWDQLLRRIKVKPGDFFYVPSGTIHALCEGTLVLETQQSSDTTYRVYDYDRVGQDGKKRDLHLQRAIEVTTVPHLAEQVIPFVNETNGAIITTFVKSEYFSVYKWEIEKEAIFGQNESFLLVSILNGSGEFLTKGKSYPLEKGTHFIIPHTVKDFMIKGNVIAIVSH